MRLPNRLFACVATASLSMGASGCTALGLLLDPTKGNNPTEVVVCDDDADPDCAPDRNVVVIEDE